ncbi:MAG TPA: nuclear transport factor 2 family protein [Jiangellaceae bacterium]
MRITNLSRVATFVTAVFLALGLGFTFGVAQQGSAQAPASGASSADQSLVANEKSAPQSSKACVRSRHHLERNKQNVEAFYTTAFNDKDPRLAVELYGGDEYIQHNPLAANGFDAFIAFVEGFTGAFPDAHIEIVRIVAECDLVVTHSLATGAEPVYTELGTKLVDIFRLDENGKIVEHWDVGAPISPTSENGNPEV